MQDHLPNKWTGEYQLTLQLRDSNWIVAVRFDHVAERHERHLTGVELDHRKAACRERLSWVLKSQLLLGDVGHQGGCVIPAVTLAAHGRLHRIALQCVLEVMSAILAAPVRMNYQPGRRLSPEICHAQCIDYQTGLHVFFHTPAHNLTAVQVQQNRQVQPTLVGGDVGDVGCPHLDGFGSVQGDPPLKHIDTFY